MRGKNHIIAGILLFSIGCKNEVPQTIPEFSMKLLDTTQVFHSKDIPSGKPTMIIWFDPNCRDCQIEAEHILAEFEKFKEVNIYMVTRHPYDELMVFYNHLRLDTCENIKIGIDTAAVVQKVFAFRGSPLTLVYNRNKILAGVFSGQANPKELLEIINKNIN